MTCALYSLQTYYYEGFSYMHAQLLYAQQTKTPISKKHHSSCTFVDFVIPLNDC